MYVCIHLTFDGTDRQTDLLKFSDGRTGVVQRLTRSRAEGRVIAYHCDCVNNNRETLRFLNYATLSA